MPPRAGCPAHPRGCQSGAQRGQLDSHEAAQTLTPFHALCPPPRITAEKTSPFLREVQVSLIDFKKCNDYLVYDSYLTPRMMCAGDLRGGRDSCQVRLLLCGAQGPGPRRSRGRLGCWGWSESGAHHFLLKDHLPSY